MVALEDLESSFEPIPPKKVSPFLRFFAVLVAFAIFFLSLEGYFYFIHPSPELKLTLSDIQVFLPKDLKDPFTSHRPEEVTQVVANTEKSIKQIANFIAADACKSGDAVCQSEALFYFVRDQITYVPDPKFHDELESPLAVLKTGGADCEDMAVLAAVLEKAIGNSVRLVLVPGHAYAQVHIPEYKDQWLNLETTCKTCKFNDIPTDIQLQKKEFVNL